MWCFYPTTEKKTKKKNRSSCHILEPVLCEPPHEVFYRPHLILRATCRQVSGSPSSRWTVLDHGLPRVMWKYSGNRLTAQYSGSWPLVLLSIGLHWTPTLFSFGSNLCAKLNRFFVSFLNQNNTELSHNCPSAKHKEIYNFSVFLLLDLKTKNLQLLLRFAARVPY